MGRADGVHFERILSLRREVCSHNFLKTLLCSQKETICQFGSYLFRDIKSINVLKTLLFRDADTIHVCLLACILNCLASNVSNFSIDVSNSLLQVHSVYWAIRMSQSNMKMPSLCPGKIPFLIIRLSISHSIASITRGYSTLFPSNSV